jgi:hypothetical protein
LLRIGVSAPSDPVHAVRAQTMPPYGVLHRVGPVAQLPGPMSVLQVPVHVERSTQTVSHGLSPATGRVLRCARNVYGGGYGARVKRGWSLGSPGSIYRYLPVPTSKYRPVHAGLQSAFTSTCTTKAQAREKYTADEYVVIAWIERTRWASHATQCTLVRIYRVSMLHELGANVPIHNR